MEDPRFPSFSGEQPQGKGEVSFAQWALEVQDAQYHCHKALVKEDMIRSLKPPAARGETPWRESNSGKDPTKIGRDVGYCYTTWLEVKEIHKSI